MRAAQVMTRRCVAYLSAAILLIGAVSVVVPAVTDAASALTGDSTVMAFGAAKFYGSTAGKALNHPLVGMANTPNGKGYWLVASDGGIFSYGNAHFYGSTGAMRLNRPIVGMAPTPSGHGYWLVASDGGIFSFGDAHFYGSTGAVRLNRSIIAITPTPDGHGYWLVASDGGIFSFGSAKFHGSTGATRLNAPIVGMAAGPGGHGYWLVASDGGIFTFGSARFHGSTGALHLVAPVVGMAATSNGGGYWLAASDGGVFTFGNAKFHGSGAGHLSVDRKIAQIAGLRDGSGYRLLELPVPLNTPVLSEGSTGPAVAMLQARLIGLGYWIDSANGSYGLTTSQAVTAFQKLHNMSRTGIFDVATRLALNNAVRPTGRSTSGYVVEVDKTHQVILVTSNGHVNWVINTSTGGDYTYTFGGHSYVAHTPDGHFSILRQINGLRVGRLGSLWRPKYITNDGIAFHGYPHVPPYPASHGCIRMTNQAINWVWDGNIMPLHTAVWVYS